MDVLNYLVSRRMRCNEAPSEREMHEFEGKINFDPDVDFREFIASCNGASGFVSKDRFIQFWSISELIALNPYYEEIDASRNLFFFGSDGSNTGFAFDKARGKVVSIDFLEIGQVDPTEMAVSFRSFIEQLDQESH